MIAHALDDHIGHQTISVLIDADNAHAAIIEGLLTEIARFGAATVKRIYGDFTSPASSSTFELRDAIISEMQLQSHPDDMPTEQFKFVTCPA